MMKAGRIITTVIMTSVLIAGIAGAAVTRVTAAPARKKEVTFSYPDGAFSNKEITGSAIYTDAYFSAKTSRRQSGLAELSMSASAAVYDKSDIKSLMKKCGFSSTSYSVSDRNDNDLTFSIGRRKIGKKTVVAVILRGTSGSREWNSNLRLGKGTVHEGFATTEKAVRKKVDSYIKKSRLKKGTVKLWITGHSRGAAVADILAKSYSDNKSYGRANVYAYTFASPKVAKVRAKTASKYNNIYNYVNRDDIVTSLPPDNSDDLVASLKDMGLLPQSFSIGTQYYEFGTYRRYGRDIVMSNKDHSDMAQSFADITGAEFDETSVAHNHCQSCYLAWMRL